MFFWLKRDKKQEVIETLKVSKTFYFNDEDAKTLLEDIKREFGLDYEKQRYITLRKIERFAIKNEIATFKELENIIKTSQELKKQLLNMLTVGETYFYRELGHLKILTEYVQNHNIKNILCVPCSSGEEVYSVLIYLQEARVQGVNIIGIDLNSNAIAKAKKGCYSERSLSLLPPELRLKYLTQQEEKYCIDVSFKNRVSFYHLNIFDTSFLQIGNFEVVFCRNMLIYFSDAEKRRAIANIYSIMSYGGILFIGHADISFVPDGFEKKTSSQGSYLVKAHK